MNYLYMLDESGNPLPTRDVLQFGRWFETAERHIGLTTFPVNGGIEVSTVFLGMDHSFMDGPPVLWETMVFADDVLLARLMELSETDDRSLIAKFAGGIDIQKRYTSREAAEVGHATMCAFIETCITLGWLTTNDDLQPTISYPNAINEKD